MSMKKPCWQILRTVLSVAMSTALLGAQDWDRMASLTPGDRIQVIQHKGPMIEAVFRALSPEALTVERRKQILSLPRDTIKQVLVKRKASRSKSIALGAAVGFVVGFPIGAASAGYLADRNSPGFGTRAEVGAGLGLIGAGIGAGLGALTGGSRHHTVYLRN
jgi:hypothetical protein